MKLHSKPLFTLKKARHHLLKQAPVYGGLLFFSLILYVTKLTSLVPFSVRESPEVLGSSNVSTLAHNAMFAPSKTLQFLILKFSSNDSLIRAASVMCLLIATLLLFVMLRKWYTTRVSLMTIGLFLTSSWVLNIGRFVTNEVLYLWVAPILLLACLSLLAKNNTGKIPVAAALLAVVLYIPGSCVLLVCGLAAFSKYIIRSIKASTRQTLAISSGIFVIGIIPLLYSFAVNSGQITTWLGYDRQQDFMPKQIANHFVSIADQLFWHGSSDAGRWLVGTPILDIFTVAMVVLGVYAYRVGYYPAREKFVFGLLVLSVLLIGFGNVATVGLLIPPLYILVANGISYMLQSWFTVFPRNPAARPLGVVLIALVVVLSCGYNLQRYFVAWPNAPDTKAALNRRV